MGKPTMPVWTAQGALASKGDPAERSLLFACSVAPLSTCMSLHGRPPSTRQASYVSIHLGNKRLFLFQINGCPQKDVKGDECRQGGCRYRVTQHLLGFCGACNSPAFPADAGMRRSRSYPKSNANVSGFWKLEGEGLRGNMECYVKSHGGAHI